MGSKSRIPPPHLRHPLPGPGMVRSDPFGLGIPHFDMSPPPEIMEQKLYAQHVEMQKLGTENQRMAATHWTLRQELAAAQHELQILHAQIGAQARSEAENLVLAREELFSKVHQLNQEIQRAHVDGQQISALLAELENLRQEYQHYSCREVEKLSAGMMNASNVDKRIGILSSDLFLFEIFIPPPLLDGSYVESNAAGQYGGATGNNENDASGHPVGQNTYEDGYVIHQRHGALPPAAIGANVGATSAYVGNQSVSGSAPMREDLVMTVKEPMSMMHREDPSSGATYDTADRSPAVLHGQAESRNNGPYGSATPPGRAGNTYEPVAPARGGNPDRR
ncbi:NAD(P)-binding Rossmann-fold superfamily protein, putative isoform 1 [Hibiscus syriacus]|uniref:NAD(P)-binding Rossmann-fold superfamily protein, putative isoform 1 n=1 Tax=Hibiscus syriacus TaxID=106335 RepID=A0A6A2XSY8_HIBSY|nr:NAD(P)-binding Rossmann-fold superfamily protein, putative isoform 1 [Hibiscus syriacus]